jgi:FG-GAP repeat.
VNGFSVRTPLTVLTRAYCLSICLLCCFIFSTATAYPAQPAPAKTAAPAKAQVVILPFEVDIPGAYTHLRNGLTGTLASRLASRANVATIAQGTMPEQMVASLKSGNHATFAQQLKQSGADCLIIGALTQKSGLFELTAYTFTQTGQPPKQFQQSFAAIDDAMTAIDELAWDISGAMFNKPRPATRPAPGHTAGSSALHTSHPDRAFRDGRHAGMTTGLEIGGPFELVSTVRSKGIPVEAMDMNVGDLDGDGREEILLLTKSSLVLYRNDDGQFRMLATVKLPGHIRYHAVTLGDLNKNGLQEIYISGSNQDRPSSSILEWDGKKIRFLLEHASWYLRTMGAQGEEPVLLGQSSLSGDLGNSNVTFMTLNADNTLTEGPSLSIPKGLNIFDFVLADIDGGKSKVVIAIDKHNRLQLYDTVGTLRWTSPDIFGASSSFFGTLTSPSNAAMSEVETAWVRTRIVVADLDGDGINDVLIGRNRLETVPFMPNLSYFEGGSLSALTWESNSLVRLWESVKVPGYIVNYQISNTDKDSKEYRIYFAETETNYPFAFWHSSATHLNCYTIRVKEHSQMLFQEKVPQQPGEQDE